jgi:acyl-coenzyme A synthetase/AMP-(fatty) acid ligase
LDESRSFAPSPEFAKQAGAQPSIYAEADADPVSWWRLQADRLTWTKNPTNTLEWDLPFARWFSDGTLNASYNCVDRHVEAGRGDKVAYHWVADIEGESRTITYSQLQKMVAQAANALTELGVKTGDRERFKETYWTRFPGKYFAGDGAKHDEDGDLWLLGRIDDVMNISGHRLSTTELEHALVGHPAVAEAAVVGASDETTVQAIVAFVTLRMTADDENKDYGPVIEELRMHVAKVNSPTAKPRQIILTPELPKTRSDKIMRRLLRDVAENRALGDVTTLTDPTVVNMIAGLMDTHSSSDD